MTFPGRFLRISTLFALLLILAVVPLSWSLSGSVLPGHAQEGWPGLASPGTGPGPAPEVAEQGADRPARPDALQEAPAEVRALLDEVLARMPDAARGAGDPQFHHWERPGHPTRAALGIKAVPGVDPDELIRRVMDVDAYEGRVAHVEASEARSAPAVDPPDSVHFYQRIEVPRVSRLQHDLMLVDAGTIRGYRVAYWYLLDEETAALDPRDGARSAHNVGAWLAAPGVVGYAFNSWPRRGDLNAVQWFSLTSGAAVVARRVVEGNIDDMASWARE